MGGLAQTQILTHVISHLTQGLGVAEAVGAPRWTLGSLDGQGAIQAEENVPAGAVDALRTSGWPITTIPALSLDVGNVTAIARGDERGLSAAADPRGQGSAVVC
jgi:gamma-glutamyltranspeptidase/glutathione hydrolase